MCGLYGGLFTPTEAGGMGAGGAFILGIARRRLSGADIRSSLLQATRTAAAVFTVLIGNLGDLAGLVPNRASWGWPRGEVRITP